MHFNLKITRMALSGIAIFILVFSVVLIFPKGTEVGGKKAIIFDKKIIVALENMSTLVPAGERIICPNFTPIVMYFMGHEVYTPYGVTSYASLLKVMDKQNYTYLLVFEGQSDIPGLTQVFNKERLPILAKDFKEIATYTTDFSRLHLYKRIGIVI
jgi:hypothetical protein